MQLLVLLLLLGAAAAASPTSTSEFDSAFGHVRPQTNPKTQQDAVVALIERVLGERSQNFSVEIDFELGPINKDVFKLEKQNDGTIKITGSNGVSAATGLHYYMKYFCDCHISWSGNQLNLPDNLPDVNVTIALNDRFRYYQNACTTSYSFVWWDWRQWERHIDWMALNSMNLVLAFNGQEAIWQRVYRKLNMTDAEIDAYFTGPAFLSWNRMGNVRGWAGPLSASWHERSLRLQKQILERMRALGITAVLPAFAGQVPPAFKRLYPTAKLYPLPRWNRFEDAYCCPMLLDPTEPLFKTVGNLFLNEMIAEFGTDHMYNCDTFNEMTPFTSNTSYLREIGRSIYRAMTDVDKNAVWIMQGWLFHHDMLYWTKGKAEALLTSVPKGKMIVLDLQSEQFPQYDRLDSYFGQPYIWCMLHNFGGTLGMFGSASIINTRVFEARSANCSTMIGTGLAPEGINQNYVVYDLMSEMAWRRESTNLTNWFADYATRRYGARNGHAVAAWNILQATVYDFKDFRLMRGKFAYNRSPRTKIPTWTWYDQCELHAAWKYLLQAADALGGSATYQHDLVDVTRQVLQNFGDEYYRKMIRAFKASKETDFQNLSNKFMEVFVSIEAILANNEHFLLGKWLGAAKRAADNAEDAKLFEYNARNQITLWGPHGEIKDYANKQWSGIVSHFFQARWQRFVDAMNSSLVNQTVFQEAAVVEDVFKSVEEPFTFDRSVFPEETTGDAVQVARDIYNKWSKRGHCARNALKYKT